MSGKNYLSWLGFVVFILVVALLVLSYSATRP